MPWAGAAGREARREVYRAGPAVPCPLVTHHAPAVCFGGAHAASLPCKAHSFPRAEWLSTERNIWKDLPISPYLDVLWGRAEMPAALGRHWVLFE